MKMGRLWLWLAWICLAMASCVPVNEVAPPDGGVAAGVDIPTVPSAPAEAAVEKPEVTSGPADILLYCMHRGEIHILVANDRFGSRGWGGFGGGDKKGETTAMTAARETSEETRGFYDKMKLFRRISGQKPLHQWGYSLYFSEVPYVPASRIMKHPIPLLNPAYMETQHYAWVPYREIEPILTKRKPTAAELKLHPRHLQAGSRSDSFWSVWIDNMRRAKLKDAFPWDR